MKRVVYSLLLLSSLPAWSSGQGVVRSNVKRRCADCRSDGVDVELNLTSDDTITFTSTSGITTTYKRDTTTSRSVGASSGVNESWHGTEEDDFRAANIVVSSHEESESYAGSFVIGDEVCRLSYIDDGHVVNCRNTSSYPPKMAPKTIRKEEETDNDTYGGDRVDDGSMTEIGLMVLWSKKAECKASSKKANCELNSSTKKTMEDLVAVAVEETRVAYEKSEIMIDLKLVHQYRHPTYKEKSNGGFDKAIEHLTFKGDGEMDDVHDLRGKYGADIVAMLIDDDQYCGVAWGGPGSELMFSVTGWDCATGTYTFGHEVGHNMGCNHDRGTDDQCNTGYYDGYNYGWRDPKGKWGTIMTYQCSTGECDDNPSDDCPYIQRFSSGTVKYNGRKLGNELNDCSKTHNFYREEVANYFSDEEEPPEECVDSFEWETKKGKNCGWAYKNPKKNCKAKDVGGNIKAKAACPIACNNEKNCFFPKCGKNEDWSPNDGSVENCGSITKKNRKQVCSKLGTNDIYFGYEVCKQCKRCKKN